MSTLVDKIFSAGKGVVFLWALLIVSNVVQGVGNWFSANQVEEQAKTSKAFFTALNDVASRAQYIDQLNATKIQEIKSFNRKYGEFKDDMLKESNVAFLNMDVPASIAARLYAYHSEAGSGGMPSPVESTGPDGEATTRQLKMYELLDALVLSWDAIDMCNGDKTRVKSSIVKQNEQARQRIQEMQKGDQ